MTVLASRPDLQTCKGRKRHGPGRGRFEWPRKAARRQAATALWQSPGGRPGCKRSKSHLAARVAAHGGGLRGPWKGLSKARRAGAFPAAPGAHGGPLSKPGRTERAENALRGAGHAAAPAGWAHERWGSPTVHCWSAAWPQSRTLRGRLGLLGRWGLQLPCCFLPTQFEGRGAKGLGRWNPQRVFDTKGEVLTKRGAALPVLHRRRRPSRSV